MKLRFIPASALLISASMATWYGANGSDPVVEASTVLRQETAGRGYELALVRKSCDTIRLNSFLADQIVRCQQQPANKDELRILAQTYVERVALRTIGKGMSIGEPMFETIPENIERDLDQGLAAIAKLHELGCTHSETFRIEATLLSNKITGLRSVWQHSSRIQNALDQAYEKDPSNPRVLIALGLRKLLAPKFFGHDANAGRTLLLKAADALELDERPLVYAALAEHSLGKLAACQELLETAVEHNPNNPFAVAVLERVVAGDPSPFANDISP